MSTSSTNIHRAKTNKYVKKSDIKKRPGAEAPLNLATYKPDPLGLRSAALMSTKHKSASNTRDPNAVKNFCVHTGSIICPYCKDSYLFGGEITKFCCSGGAATVENVANTLKFPDQLLMYFDRDLQKQKRWGDIQAQSIMLNSLFQMASTTGIAGEANGKGKRTLKTNGDPVILPPNGKKEQFAQVYCIDGIDKQTDRRIEHLKSFSGASIPREIIRALTEFISKNHKMADKGLFPTYELYKEAQEQNQPTRFEKLIVLSRAEVRYREHQEQGADFHNHQVMQLNGVSKVYIPDADTKAPTPANRSHEAHKLCPGEIDAINAVLGESEDEEPNFIQNQTPDSDAEEDAKEDAEVTWEDQDDYVPGEGDDEDEDMQQYAERIGKGRRYLSNRLFVRFRTRRPALGIFHCYAVWDSTTSSAPARGSTPERYYMKTLFKMRSEAADDLRQRPLPRKIFLLPYSYPGGKAYMQRKFLDTMAISARVGAPSFYVTFAGNPEWPEIIHQRKHEKQPLTELYDIQWRVFLRKLNELKKNLKQCFGEQVGMAMSIEQQRTFDDQSKSDTLFATL
ncbi:hypothetical protein QR680_012862 [Steinernema hermaphroditum]|uniref:Helitron helicase-like domain-containing protein n=1 Tax=Steinernema hermaphroditum TaxID=289476 RepID=A0AA39I6D1_9BILA|nr:hypothetical protein QR680_012862 [Steinernema hermaphroditum]